MEIIDLEDLYKPDPKWDSRFLNIALQVASWSKDPSTQVGAVLVDLGRRIIGVGYNGFPRGCNDDKALYADREVKYKRVVHAEVNAILNAITAPAGAILYCTHHPCSACTAQLIQAGIERVVFIRNPDFDNRYRADQLEAQQLLKEAGIDYSMTQQLQIIDGSPED